MNNEKIVLVTGATDGIGKQTAAELANHNFHVVVHGRSTEKVESTIREIERIFPNAKLSSIVSDLSSLTQTRNLAAEIKNRFDHINVLINNAGVYMNKRVLTEDGFETTFAVNHLSHFLLTNLLIEIIPPGGRIINVSSVAHLNAKLMWDNLNCENYFDGYYAYSLSKLANVLFTKELADKVARVNISTYSLHPGVISTKLLMAGFNITGASLKKGAETSVFLATSDDVTKNSGEYFVDKKIFASHQSAYIKNVCEKFWDVSSEMVGLQS